MVVLDLGVINVYLPVVRISIKASVVTGTYSTCLMYGHDDGVDCVCWKDVRFLSDYFVNVAARFVRFNLFKSW